MKLIEMSKLNLLLWISSLFFAVSANAFIGDKPLSPEKAFAFSVTVDDAHKITAHWQLAQGYYLYRDKIHFVFEPAMTTDISLPKGEIKQDLNHGQYEVYIGNVSVPVILHTTLKQVRLTVDYQGCSEKGVCYPRMHQSITLNLPVVNHAAKTSLTSLLTDQYGIRAMLGSQNMFVMLMIFAALGLLLAFTPCILPMIPILTSIIVGHKQPVSTKKAFFLSSTYVLGASLTYAAAGMIAASMGSSLQASLQQPWIIAIVSGMFVLLSFSLFGFYDLRLPGKWQSRITSVSRKQEGGTYMGAFIMGVISTLIVSPCVTAPLVGVLMYIAETGNIALGGGALFMLGLGMGIPLIMLGVTAGKWLPRRGPWMKGVQIIFGLFMLAMAFWLLARVASFNTLMIFSAVLLLGAAFYFGFYKPQHHGNIIVNRSLGMVMGLAGLLVIGTMNMPLVMNAIVANSEQHLAFIVVHSTEELNQQLSLAKAAGKPVLLDFYADWCESCVVMDKKVFSLPGVVKGLDKFVLIRADLSKNSEADEALLKTYDVVAPPTVLFFNNYGQEVNSHRIVGALNAAEFMTRINIFITASCDKNLTC
jgi:thiol:disulfide interchange protein DsbD